MSSKKYEIIHIKKLEGDLIFVKLDSSLVDMHKSELNNRIIDVEKYLSENINGKIILCWQDENNKFHVLPEDIKLLQESGLQNSGIIYGLWIP